MGEGRKEPTGKADRDEEQLVGRVARSISKPHLDECARKESLLHAPFALSRFVSQLLPPQLCCRSSAMVLRTPNAQHGSWRREIASRMVATARSPARSPRNGRLGDF